jgi:phage shock protein PspC (stress-responsive transcriptional regulator)
MERSDPMSERPKLVRSRDRMIAGVCAGLAEYLGWPVTRVRILYVLVSVLSAAFPGTLVYIILWFVMPGPDAAASRNTA